MRRSSFAIGVLATGLGIMVGVIVVTHYFPGKRQVFTIEQRPGQQATPTPDPLLLGGPLQRNLEGVTPEIFLIQETGTTVPQFKTHEFTVPPGKVISLTFRNHSTVGHQHNWVLVKPGTADEVERAARTAGPDRSFIPDSPHVLAFALLTDPGQSRTIVFRSPEEPGDYPFFCSFPGHIVTMNGVFHVKPR